MGTVFGAEKPSAYTMEYTHIKALLVQMQTAGQGVIETLNSYRKFVDYIIAEEECQAPKQKSKSKGQKNDSGQQYIRETRDSLQKLSLLQMQSILQSIKTLDLSVQTIVKQNLSESFHQSLEETWQQTVQNCVTSESISTDNHEGETEDQVHGKGGPQIENRGLGTDVVKQQEIASLQTDVRLLQCQIKMTVSSVESLNEKLQQTANDTDSLRSQLSSTESQKNELQEQLNTIQSIEDRLKRIEQQTADDSQSIDSRLSTTESHVKEQQAQLSTKIEYIQSIEAQLQSLKQQAADDTNSLKSQLSSAASLAKELQAQLSTKTEYIQSIEAQLQSLQQQTADDTNSLKSQLSSTEIKNKELQTQLSTKTEYIQSIEAQLRSLKQQTTDDTNSLKSQLSSAGSLAKELQTQLSIKTECIKSVEAQLQSLKQQTADDTNSLISQLSTSDNTNKKLWLELRTKTEILKSTEERLSEKIKTIERQEHAIKSLTELNLELKNTVQTAQKKNIHLHEQLRRQRTVDLQIWFQRTDILTQVAGEIQEQVKKKCQQTANMVVNCFTPDAQDDLQPCKPTLVLCINASRLGTDVSMALGKIQDSPAVAVIVLHHKPEHALPKQSSDKTLTSPEYKELGGVFDMAFWDEKGLYPCSMNDTALNKILEFLKYRISLREFMK